MKRSTWLAFGSFLILASPLFAASPLSGACKADFSVKATMDSFVGHATSEPISLDPAKDQKLTITVSVDQMETGKAKRDREMLHMFDAEKFPAIVGTANMADIQALDPASDHAELPIEVTLHGETKTVMADVSALRMTEENLSFDAAFTVPLREFGLTPPSVMKLIRVGNDVHVVAHIALAN